MSHDTELKKIAWQACEIFRSSIELSKSTQITLALFILKFLSDINSDRRNHFDSSLWPKVWRELEVPPEWDWEKLLTLSKSTDVIYYLDRIVSFVEQRNPDLLGGVFQNLAFDDLRNSPDQSAIINAVRLISDADLHPSRHAGDAIGNVFDALLHLFSEVLGKNAGSFYVPPELSLLLADILDPQPGEVILDPVCGAGLLLTRLTKGVETRILGQDWRSSEVALCKMNLLLHGLGNVRVQLSSALSAPMLNEDAKVLQADIVASNPPFGVRELQGESAWSERVDILRYGISSRGLADYAFIAHMLEAARASTGRVAVIVSLGVLTREDGEQFRRCIIEENLLAGIISLPPNLFHMTRVPVAVLFFRRRKPTSDVLFVDASKCFTTDGSINRLTDQGVRRTASAVRKFKTVREFARRVSQEEIRESGYRLSVPLYINHKSGRADLTKLNTVNQEIRRLERELTEVRSELDEALRRIGVEFN